MTFFNRYLYIWKFDSDQEKSFEDFSQNHNITYLQLICFILALDAVAYIFIDFFRGVDYFIVLCSRLMLLTTLIAILLITWKVKISPLQKDLLSLMVLSSTAAFLFIANSFGRMPVYFLSNSSVAMLTVVVTISGLRFRHAFYFNLLFFSALLLYSKVGKPDGFFYTQYPNLVTTLGYSSFAGAIIENIKRRNFLQYLSLLQEKQKVEELNQQKARIISILSHDVASPINSLSGLLELQSKNIMSDEEINPFLGNIRKRLVDVSTMVYGVVRWSRSQMDGFVLEKKKVEFVGLIEECVVFVSPSAEEKLLNITLNATKPVWISVDEEMIRIAIRNLIMNAIKFSKTNAEVLINIFVQKNKNVVFEITNMGVIIPVEAQSKLFRFQGSSNLGTMGEKGTGLGLPMTKHFIEFNSGTIKLKNSDPDTGTTTFSFTLPLVLSS